MSLEIQAFSIPGPVLVAPTRFQDQRGYFLETYSARAFAEAGISEIFVQDNQSMSVDVGTIRGIHFQAPPHAQAKLVRVIRGRILDIALDIRAGSPTYGCHVAVELTEENGHQFYVPVGFAHGFCTLEPRTEVAYKVTEFYSPRSEMGVLWNDPALRITWPSCAGAVTSTKDRALPLFADFVSPFRYTGSNP